MTSHRSHMFTATLSATPVLAPARLFALGMMVVASAAAWAQPASAPAAGAAPTIAVSEQAAAVHKAVELGLPAGVRRALAQAGADPNAPDAQGQVPLYVAIRAQDMPVAQALLEHPAIQVDAVNRSLETPLMMAALRGQLDMAKTLVLRGAKVDRSGWTPLHYAAAGPNPAVVRWLVEQGAALEAQSPNGTTPLMMAAGYGAIDAADLLLKLGADAKRVNQVGIDAVAFAKRAGRDALARRLGASVAPVATPAQPASSTSGTSGTSSTSSTSGAPGTRAP